MWVIGITAHRASARSLSDHLALRISWFIFVPSERCNVPVKVAQRIVTLDALANSKVGARSALEE